jgi:hypothetical protein
MDGHRERDSMDAVIEAYKAGIDRTLLRENLKRTPGERLDLLGDLLEFHLELRRAGKESFPKRPAPVAP